MPDAAIDLAEALEHSPVLQHLGLSRGHWHHANVRHNVLIVEVVIQKLRLVDRVEYVH